MKCTLIILALIAIAAAVPRNPKHTDDFLTFWNLHKIQHYFEHLDEENDFVSVDVIGTTSENRPIHAVKVSLPHKDSKHHRKVIMVESGLHPREWIAPMVNLYLIHMIVEHAPEYNDLLENVDFVFIPMANPDGYEYSHTVDRNWNKNRRFIGRNCHGVDINRNFPFKFLPSSDPCSEHYGGFLPGSEAETQAIMNLMSQYEGRIEMYISLQAYGEQILTPYNYAPLEGLNQEESQALGDQVSKIIELFNNRHYETGIGGNLLETPERGTSSDYAHGKKSVPLAYTIKLPAGGETGYDVPESQLDGILTESWFGFLEFAAYVNKPNWTPY